MLVVLAVLGRSNESTPVLYKKGWMGFYVFGLGRGVGWVRVFGLD